MTKINIPEGVLPGFNIILSLSPEELNKLISYLNEIPLGTIGRKMVDDLTPMLGAKNSYEITKTLTSFSELLEDQNVNYTELASNLTLSYQEIETGNAKDEQIETLQKNLVEIFSSSKNLTLSLKARDLVLENDNLFDSCKVVTDLRLVFADELEDRKRHGVTIHRLRIEYRRERMLKEIFLSLDLQDLKKMKDELERAIKKEEIIKSDYNQLITFI